MLILTNPSTGDLIQEIEEDTSHSVQTKMERVQEGKKFWSKTPYDQRTKSIQTFRNLVLENQSKLARTLTLEVGKPITQSLQELSGLIQRLDYFIKNTPQVLNTEEVFRDHGAGIHEKIDYEPLGVIVNISAWNYPYYVGSNVLIPALLTGNTVIYKPSEYATLTGLAITELLYEAGIPHEAFVPVIGGGAVSAELIQTPGDSYQGLYFTGSYATGKKIAEALAGKMVRTQFELGGKDPTYVCEDAPVSRAAQSLADGAFYNSGQSCCSVERIYVHEKIYPAFLECFMEQVQSFKLGDPFEANTYIGPLTRKAQLITLEDQVQDALTQGAKVLCGGKPANRPGNYFEPTVLVNVNHSMKLMKEETFGPVIGIQKVSSDDEALHWMNDTEYGLTAGVYTPNEARATRILKEVQTGSVYWNCCDRVSPRLPWSGRGHSGMGSTLSRLGIQAFLQPKAWHLKT